MAALVNTYIAQVHAVGLRASIRPTPPQVAGDIVSECRKACCIKASHIDLVGSHLLTTRKGIHMYKCMNVCIYLANDLSVAAKLPRHIG